MEEDGDRIYIAHQISADTEEERQKNIDEILNISRYMHLNGDNLVPEAPYLYRLSYLDDDDPEERRLGIQANSQYFEKEGLLQGLAVTGPTVLGSEGTKGEIKLALENGIPVGTYNPPELDKEGVVEDYNPDLNQELEEYLSDLEIEAPKHLKLDI